MKFIKRLGNPYVFISLYLLQLFEGEHFGGFYLVYLFLALPHGASYALLSVAGIILLISGYHTRNRAVHFLLVPIAVIVMIAGLLDFIFWGTVDETFSLFFPILTFIFCGVSCSIMLTTHFASTNKIKTISRS